MGARPLANIRASCLLIRDDMAKRFTDTDKWKKKWYLDLGPKLREARQFVLDDCDHAGIWEINLDRIKYHIGQKVTLEDIKLAFNHDLVLNADETQMMVLCFNQLQYKTELNPENRVHASVIEKIKEFKKNKDLASPMLGAKDKEEEKDKVMDKEKEEEEDTHLNFDALYEKYPKKEGKSAGLKVCKNAIKTPEALIAAHKAVERYVDHLRRNKVDPKYIKHFSTFMNSWEDWLDESVGTVDGFIKPSLKIEDILANKKKREEELNGN